MDAVMERLHPAGTRIVVRGGMPAADVTDVPERPAPAVRTSNGVVTHEPAGMASCEATDSAVVEAQAGGLRTILKPRRVLKRMLER
jgi:hypothetical protein